LLLSPLVNILRGGLINAGIGALVPLFLAIGWMILMVWVWPGFIRDVWQPASIAGDDLTELRDQTRRESELRKCNPAQSDAGLLSQRMTPARW
jgi:hypothetical protein